MAKIEVDQFDAVMLNRICEDSYVGYQGFLAGLARAVESAVSAEGTHEEIPGADGEPDYVGLTYKERL